MYYLIEHDGNRKIYYGPYHGKADARKRRTQALKRYKGKGFDRSDWLSGEGAEVTTLTHAIYKTVVFRIEKHAASEQVVGL